MPGATLLGLQHELDARAGNRLTHTLRLMADDHVDVFCGNDFLRGGNKACIARQFDRWWSQYVPVYAYQFDDETAPSYFPPVSYPTRAFHTSELEYIFTLFHGGQGRPHALNPAQTKLADEMALYWGTFARNGNPNSASDPHWQPYAQRADDVIALIEPKPYMTFGYGKQTYHNSMHNSCEVWDPIPLTGARS